MHSRYTESSIHNMHMWAWTPTGLKHVRSFCNLQVRILLSQRHPLLHRESYVYLAVDVCTHGGQVFLGFCMLCLNIDFRMCKLQLATFIFLCHFTRDQHMMYGVTLPCIYILNGPWQHTIFQLTHFRSAKFPAFPGDAEASWMPCHKRSLGHLRGQEWVARLCI